MKSRDLRTYHMHSRHSARRSFDSLTLAQDDRTGGKLTISEFIALIADKLQLQLKSAEAAHFYQHPAAHTKAREAGRKEKQPYV